MSEAEKQTVGALVSALVLMAPGFLLHEAPRFPGTLAGGLLGVAGATLFERCSSTPWSSAAAGSGRG